MTHPSPSPELADLAVLRGQIDAIDSAMHGLLMQRSEIIDELIAVKKAQGGGSAFRPAREAAMMKALARRHHGSLPLETVEGIWRIIISTFTWLQAPYEVHAETDTGEGLLRDVARFHFGFSVPLRMHESPYDVIEAVRRAPDDLGLVAVTGSAPGWWRALLEPDAPRIIARLPFIERPDHPVGMPVFVMSRPLQEALVPDILLVAVRLPPRVPSPRVSKIASKANISLTCLDTYEDNEENILLLEVETRSLPSSLTEESLMSVITEPFRRETGDQSVEAFVVGGHASRFSLP